jgi:hypothetical protein
MRPSSLSSCVLVAVLACDLPAGQAADQIRDSVETTIEANGKESSARADSTPVVSTTIEAIDGAPLSFHDKAVRVRGVIDECYLFSCDICTSARLPNFKDTCLSVGFDLKSDPELYGWRADEFYRFTDVTVEGHFDARCHWRLSEGPKVKGPDGQVIQRITVCTDRVTTLQVHRVVAVHQRWPSSQGLYHSIFGVPLKKISDEDKANLFARYRSVAAPRVQDDETYSDTTKYRVFEIPVVRPRSVAFCECISFCTEEEWPKMTNHFLESPNNRVECRAAVRVGGDWAFSPQPLSRHLKY